MSGEANVPIRMNQGATKLVVGTGGAVVPESETQAAAIADVADDLADDANGAAIAAAVNANAAAINEILAALRGVGIIASA